MSDFWAQRGPGRSPPKLPPKAPKSTQNLPQVAPRLAANAGTSASINNGNWTNDNWTGSRPPLPPKPMSEAPSAVPPIPRKPLTPVDYDHMNIPPPVPRRGADTLVSGFTDRRPDLHPLGPRKVGVNANAEDVAVEHEYAAPYASLLDDDDEHVYGQSQGTDHGYNQANYSNGYENGYNSGYDHNYDNGYDSYQGRSNGYNERYNEQYTQSYSDDYNNYSPKVVRGNDEYYGPNRSLNTGINAHISHSLLPETPVNVPNHVYYTGAQLNSGTWTEDEDEDDDSDSDTNHVDTLMNQIQNRLNIDPHSYEPSKASQTPPLHVKVGLSPNSTDNVNSTSQESPTLFRAIKTPSMTPTRTPTRTPSRSPQRASPSRYPQYEDGDTTCVYPFPSPSTPNVYDDYYDDGRYQNSSDPYDYNHDNYASGGVTGYFDNREEDYSRPMIPRLQYDPVKKQQARYNLPSLPDVPYGADQSISHLKPQANRRHSNMEKVLDTSFSPRDHNSNSKPIKTIVRSRSELFGSNTGGEIANKQNSVPRKPVSSVPFTGTTVNNINMFNGNESVASMDDASLSSSFRASFRSSTRSVEDSSLMVKLGLPSIPVTHPQFDASKLSTKSYDKCPSIWSLSAMSLWLASFPNGDMEIPFNQLIKALAGLFMHYIPTMSWIQTERIAFSALETMKKCGFVVVSPEGTVTFNMALVPTGVFPQLTVDGCYSMSHVENVLEDQTTADSRFCCYSSRCSLTLPVKSTVTKVDLNIESNSDWAAYYNIPSEVLAELSKQELRYQYAIHEIITGEESYIRDLSILLEVFGKSLANQFPPVMKNQEEFCEKTFGSIQGLMDVNSKYLLRPLKARQEVQGPYIAGIADIVLEWLEHAKQAYLKYSRIYLFSDRTMRREKESNTAFAAWFDQTSRDPRTHGTPHSFYFHRAIPRLARYALLLRAIQKVTIESSPEWQLLDKAAAQCESLTGECNKSLAQSETVVELMDFKQRIQFKSPEEVVDLKLRDRYRKIIKKGDVTRRGDYKLEWIESHLILLDNYLILSKIRKGMNGNMYYITKRPIPMDLLVLESATGDPVTKNTRLGVGTFTSHASTGTNSGGTASSLAADTKKRSKQLISGLSSPSKSSSSSSGLLTSNPSSSTGGNTNGNTNTTTSVTVTTLDESEKELLYPIKVSHLGRFGATYTLYASSAYDRGKWIEAIIKAKTDYGSAIHTLNGEPFKVKVLTEHSFSYEQHGGPKLPTYSPGTSLDRGLNESNERMVGQGGDLPRSVAQSRINCSVTFTFEDGHEYCIVGLDQGAYIWDTRATANYVDGSSVSQWKRCLNVSKITQVDVIVDLNVLLVLTERSLVYYHLDAVIIRSYRFDQEGNFSSLTGYKLSKNRDVQFFTVGKLKDRILVMYKQRDGLSSVFKVIEPIKEKGQHSRRSKMLYPKNDTISSTEYFRELERFYLPGDSYDLCMFKSTFAVCSNKGFELMSLDLKIPQVAPVANSITSVMVQTINKSRAAKNLKPFSPDSLKKKLENLKPIGIYRISEKLLILCYEEIAVYCDNYGNLSGTCVIDFICRAKSAAFQHPYLVLADDEIVEVRRVDREGQLKQIITGKDVRLLDGKEGQITIALAHPKIPGRQLLIQLARNEFVVDDDSSSLAAM